MELMYVGLIIVKQFSYKWCFWCLKVFFVFGLLQLLDFFFLILSYLHFSHVKSWTECMIAKKDKQTCYNILTKTQPKIIIKYQQKGNK